MGFHWRYLFAGVLILVGFVYAGRIFAAWADPTLDPPAGNISAPINISLTAQEKLGPLTIGGAFIGKSKADIAGDLRVNTDKFFVGSARGDVTIAGSLKVGESLLTVEEFPVIQGFVRIGEDPGGNALLKVNSSETNYASIIATKPPSLGINAPAVSAVISNPNSSSIYARNDRGVGIEAETSIEGMSSIFGTSTKGSTAFFSFPIFYSAGIKGYIEADASVNDQAGGGVVGISGELSDYKDDEVRLFGVVGGGGKINNPQVGSSARYSGGVYGEAGNIYNGVPSSMTFGVFGKAGLVGGSGTSWAGYFEGDVKITGNLESTTITNSDSISTRALSVTTQQGYGIEVEKTAGAQPDGLSAVKVTSADGAYEVLLGGAGQEADQYYALKADGPVESVPPEGFGDQKQIVLDSMDNGRNAYFRYSKTDSCVELWVPKDQDDLIDGESPSLLGEQWGQQCSPTEACGATEGEKCLLIDGVSKKSCASYPSHPNKRTKKCPTIGYSGQTYWCCQSGPPPG